MRHVLHWIILQGDESLRMINVGIDDESMGNLHKLKVVLENNTCFLFLQQHTWLTVMWWLLCLVFNVIRAPVTADDVQFQAK